MSCCVFPSMSKEIIDQSQSHVKSELEPWKQRGTSSVSVMAHSCPVVLAMAATNCASLIDSQSNSTRSCSSFTYRIDLAEVVTSLERQEEKKEESPPPSAPSSPPSSPQTTRHKLAAAAAGHDSTLMHSPSPRHRRKRISLMMDELPHAPLRQSSDENAAAWLPRAVASLETRKPAIPDNIEMPIKSKTLSSPMVPPTTFNHIILQNSNEPKRRPFGTRLGRVVSSPPSVQIHDTTATINSPESLDPPSAPNLKTFGPRPNNDMGLQEQHLLQYYSGKQQQWTGRTWFSRFSRGKAELR
jgi:hypothetical protein